MERIDILPSKSILYLFETINPSSRDPIFPTLRILIPRPFQTSLPPPPAFINQTTTRNTESPVQLLRSNSILTVFTPLSYSYFHPLDTNRPQEDDQERVDPRGENSRSGDERPKETRLKTGRLTGAAREIEEKKREEKEGRRGEERRGKDRACFTMGVPYGRALLLSRRSMSTASLVPFWPADSTLCV